MFSSPYLPHAVYSVAITSISIHLISQKRAVADDRARVAARLSILQSVAQQLREDKDISLEELDRLHRLARPPPRDTPEEVKDRIGWKEVMFGKKTREQGMEMSEYDKKDWEKVKRELEES